MTVDEKKIIHGMVTTAFKMLTRYEGKLTDEQWESLIDEGNALEKGVYSSAPYNKLWRDLFLMVGKFHEGKY